MHTQAEIELEVFCEFTNASGLPIRFETISHRSPPEPDIVCEIIGEGLVGFDITELIDHRFMAGLDLMAKTQTALRDFWQSALSSTQSSAFRRKYGNALLHFRFGSNVGDIQRRAAFGPIFEALLAVPDGFVGDALRLDPRFLPVLEVVSVRRGSFMGPAIDVDNFSWIGDPTQTAISKKLSKTYHCDYPIDLLAYVDWDILPPEAAWKAAAHEAADGLSESQLRRIWVFDRTKKQVLYVNPEPSHQSAF
jgi:hypothetical protein